MHIRMQKGKKSTMIDDIHSILDKIYRLQKPAVKIILEYEYNNDIACSMDK